jgi:hypothetical protein
MTEQADPTWYEIPDGALIAPGGGRHWLHIKTAEQLARVMWQCKTFDVRRLYQAGGISDGSVNEPEGLVALHDERGQLLMIGSFIAGGIQWPTSPAGDSSVELRTEYAAEIQLLQSRVAELLPTLDRISQPKSKM